MKKVPCPECGKPCHPKGLFQHRRSHSKNPTTSANKQKLPWSYGQSKEQKAKPSPERKLEILTNEDPTLGNVIDRITEKYKGMDSPYHRADYLKRLYAALYDIDQELEG